MPFATCMHMHHLVLCMCMYKAALYNCKAIDREICRVSLTPPVGRVLSAWLSTVDSTLERMVRVGPRLSACWMLCSGSSFESAVEIATISDTYQWRSGPQLQDRKAQSRALL